MILCAELSLYPLQNSYVDTIQAFIADLAAASGLQLTTNAMSTQLKGEHDAVMQAVSHALRQSRERGADQVLVCKFIPMDLSI